MASEFELLEAKLERPEEMDITSNPRQSPGVATGK